MSSQANDCFEIPGVVRRGCNIDWINKIDYNNYMHTPVSFHCGIENVLLTTIIDLSYTLYSIY